MTEAAQGRERTARERTEPVATSRWPVRVALALALAPLLVSAVALLVKVGTSFYSVSDWATDELHVRDVGHHAVLLGPYSRDGWFHPGPAYFYVLAVPYRLLGSMSIALFIGALLVNGGAIAGMAYVARRVGGTDLSIVTLLGCATLVSALGPAFVRNPWNPYLPVFPLGLLVYLTWAMLRDETWALPCAVGLMSFLVQTHIGYATITIPLVVAGGVVLLIRVWREGRNVIRPAAVALAVLVVMWLPPVVQQLTNTPGNLGVLVRYFRRPPLPMHSFMQGVKVVAVQFSRAPEWVAGRGTSSPFTGEPEILARPLRVPILAPVFVGALAVAWWRRRVSVVLLGGVVCAGLLLGAVSVMRTIGNAYAYRMLWALVLGMLAAVVVGWTVWAEVVRRFGATAGRILTGVSLAGLAAFAVGNSIAAVYVGAPLGQRPKVLRAIVPPTLAALPHGRGDVVVTGDALYRSGLVLALERAGVRARVPAKGGDAYGKHREHHSGPALATVTVLTNADVDRPGTTPPGRLVAYWGTRARADHARRVRRLERVLRECHGSQCFARAAAIDPGSAAGVYVAMG